MAKKIFFLFLSFVAVQLHAQMLKPLSLGVTDEVIATTTDNNYFYAATRHNYGVIGKGFSIVVNKWNGFYWQQLPGIIFNDSSQVRVMAVYKNEVYLAGNFIVKTPVITNARTMVRFNGTLNNWEAVGTNGAAGFSFLGAGYGSINTMAVFKNQLFIGGAFYTVVNGDTTQNLVVYNGVHFNKIGAGPFGNTGTNGAVHSLCVFNDSLFIGGAFTKAGGITSFNLAAIDSAFSWKAFSFSPSIGIAKVTAYQNNLAILTLDLQGKIYLRNSSGFQLITANLISNQITDIEEYNNELWASGGFYSSNVSVVKYSTIWSASGLAPVSVQDIVKFRGGLYVVSSNDFVGNLRINKLAQIVFSHTRISGHLYQDLNHNCKFDNNDRPFANRIIQIKAIESFNLYTDVNGYYSATIPFTTASYTVSLVKFKNWDVDSPCSQNSYTFITANNSTLDTLDFSLIPLVSGVDLKVNITPNNGYSSRRDFVEGYTITYANNGTQDLIAAAGIKVVFNKKLSNFSSPQSFILNGNEAVWSVANLKVGEQRSISFTAKVKADSFNLNDQVNFIASSGYMDLDAMDNSDTLVQRIGQTSNSPVLKDVYPLPPSNDSISLVTNAENEINYLIHFENTSSYDTIHSVIVIDTIDINTSIQYIQETGASHSYSTKIFSCPPALGKGVIVWTFTNISLPPFENNDNVSNRGHIGFKIRFNNTLPIGTIIKNKAYVVFDYFDPLKTNNTYAKISTTLSGIGNSNYRINNERICANPVSSYILLFKSYEPNASYKIVNTSGATVLEGTINSKTIEVNGLMAGIYFIMTMEGNRLFSQKIIIN